MLILKATHGPSECPIVSVPAYSAETVIQGASPGIGSTGLRRTPPETEVANEVECPTAGAVATRKP